MIVKIEIHGYRDSVGEVGKGPPSVCGGESIVE
jgi:hypothetical protein